MRESLYTTDSCLPHLWQ